MEQDLQDELEEPPSSHDSDNDQSGQRDNRASAGGSSSSSSSSSSSNASSHSHDSSGSSAGNDSGMPGDASDASDGEQENRRAGRARRPRAAEIIASAPGVSEQVIDVPAFGQIRYNPSFSFMRAVCTFHGKDCRRQRTLVRNNLRPGQGRPLGLLMNWLQKAADFESADEHKRMGVGSFADRQEARRIFAGLEGSDAFLDKERGRLGGEGDEPRTLP